jgi:hypothetical protein
MERQEEVAVDGHRRVERGVTAEFLDRLRMRSALESERDACVAKVD